MVMTVVIVKDGDGNCCNVTLVQCYLSLFDDNDRSGYGKITGCSCAHVGGDWPRSGVDNNAKLFYSQVNAFDSYIPVLEQVVCEPSLGFLFTFELPPLQYRERKRATNDYDSNENGGNYSRSGNVD